MCVCETKPGRKAGAWRARTEQYEVRAFPFRVWGFECMTALLYKCLLEGAVH